MGDIQLYLTITDKRRIAGRRVQRNVDPLKMLVEEDNRKVNDESKYFEEQELFVESEATEVGRLTEERNVFVSITFDELS